LASVILFYLPQRVSDELLQSIRIAIGYEVGRDYPSRNRYISNKPKPGIPIKEFPLARGARATWLGGNDVIVEVHPSRPARSARPDIQSQALSLAASIGVSVNIRHPDADIKLAVRLVSRRVTGFRAVQILFGTTELPVS